MEWTDDGIVLKARKHGETDAIVTLFTRSHGRHLGIVHGGAGRRRRGTHQPGNLVRARWRARLSEQLGWWSAELERSFACLSLDDPTSLAALSSACAVAETALPERTPHPRAYAGLLAFLESLSTGEWPAAYVRWEVQLLAELGYGLDLSACAATGQATDLRYVSPKSGRAVSAAAGEAYAERLLPLPAFLTQGGSSRDFGAIRDGLLLTGHFLASHVFTGGAHPEPAARSRFIACLVEKTPTSGINGGHAEGHYRP